MLAAARSRCRLVTGRVEGLRRGCVLFLGWCSMIPVFSEQVSAFHFRPFWAGLMGRKR